MNIITHVKKKNNVITHVLTSNKITFTTEEVISRIEGGEVFYTSSTQAIPPKVEIFILNNKKYIRTVFNNIIKDNLDNLPAF